MLRRIFGRREDPSPASPEAVVREHFEAMVAHDIHRILATLAPERARLYDSPRSMDKRRLTLMDATVHAVTPTEEQVPMPAFTQRYGNCLALKVDYEIRLVPPEQRRDPTLREGRQWAYYILVSEKPGKPWLIADWGV
ncbi:MAG TPA: DUF4829 domain-containing protein [Symbiobacteriaceae bacterium]|nr:DUF4829 domain-containing protein [Symbiobacteriaceae bacterium]